MVLMSLQVMEVVYLVKPINIKNNKRGLLGAFVTGLIGGAFASPCATPILIAIAGVTTSSGNVAYGVILMAMYGIGANFLVVLSGMSTGLATNILKKRQIWQVRKHSQVFNGSSPFNHGSIPI